MTPSGPTLSRRHALTIAGGALGAPLLASCGRERPTQAPEPGQSGSAISGTVRLALSAPNQSYEPFMQQQMQRFTELTGVQVELRFFPPPEYANAINLAFTSGDAPDVYRLTGPSPATNMINSYRNDWLQPLTPFLTDDYRSRPFPEGTFTDQANSGLFIGEDMYGVPLESLPYTQVRILYSNDELLASVGATQPPATWGEMEQIARDISAADGEAHGFAVAGQETVVSVDAIASTAGVPMGGLAPINLVTGTAGSSEPHYLATVELLRRLNADGILVPGWESWNGARPIQEFALGAMGMYVGANFHARQIRAANPDLGFTMSAVPVPDSGRASYTRVPGLNQPYWGMSRTAQSPEAAWALLDFMSTADFQGPAYDALGLIPVLPSAYEGRLDPDASRILEIMGETQRVAPTVLVNGPDADQLLSAATAAAPTPNAIERYTKAITENSDYEGPAREFDEGLNAAIDQTVEELTADGLDVSRDDLAFPDWDPMQDYQA